jgi:hypothetical protein
MKTINQAIRRYRALCQARSSLNAKEDKLREKMTELRTLHQKKTAEIKKLRQVIDYCVITGQSPTQALLSNTPEQIETALIHHQQENESYGFITVPSFNSVPGGAFTISSAGTININTPSTLFTVTGGGGASGEDDATL